MRKIVSGKQKKNKGSSTILVILITLTLLMFGVMGMMSGYTSYKISKKSLEWTKENYLLESKAQVFLHDLTKSIQEGTKEVSVEFLQKEIQKYDKYPDREMEIETQNLKSETPEYVYLVAYFLGEGDRKLEIKAKIFNKKVDKPYEIVSWKMINPEFIYDTVMYSEGLVGE